jgi:hypothetical protein
MREIKKRKQKSEGFPFINNISDQYLGSSVFYDVNGTRSVITHSAEIHQISRRCEFCLSDNISYQDPFQCGICRINICEACTEWKVKRINGVKFITDICQRCGETIGIERI